MRNKIIYSVILICLLPFFTNAQSNKTKILVLGTHHLSQIIDFEPIMLDKVISKLDTFNFDVIGIEKMSGELLNDIRSRQDSSFDGITKGRFGASYLAVADTIQAIKNITFLEAKKNIQILLNKESLTINDRKKLLFNYLGTTDLPSAALQYQYINNKSIFTTEFEKYIVHIIEKNIATHSEYYSLAVSLAKRENINQLQPIDNIQDESLLYKYYPDFIEDYKKHSDKLNKINQLPVYQKFNQLIKEGIQANDLSKLYEFLNSDDYKTQDYNGQWSIWLKTNFPSGSDRARYSLWEMRNLQITANIMKVVARNPGKKILIIIGASHRGFLEEYLKQMEDVEVMKYE